MRHTVFLKQLFYSCLLMALPATGIFAQVALAKPMNILRPTGANVFTINISGSIGGSPSSTYNWTVSPSTGVTITHNDPFDPAATAAFSSAANGVYTFTLTRGSTPATVSVTVGNLVACSNTGQDISLFNVANGELLTGSEPAYMFDPFPDATTTAALGVTLNGYYYYMPNLFNNGNVTLYAASPDGLTVAPVASIDLNGSSNNNLGFVRLAIDGAGKGWMLAGDGSIVYLASFVANGLNSTTIELVDDNVGLVGGNAAVFQNGDLCFSGTGAIFALANNGAGITQIFTGTPNGVNTILTKKWDLVDAAGNNFAGNVNGVAFDILGSLYISAGGATGGLYYINQNTVNTATGTVQFSLVWSGTGLTDLASNYFPAQTTLPVKLLSFSGQYHNNKTILNWETEAEQGFSYFDIERSNNGGSFISIGTKPAAGIGGNRQTYQFTDDLTGVSGHAFSYRLKMVDIDGKYKNSSTVLIRKESTGITGIIINPSPVSNGVAIIRFTSSANGDASFCVVDMSGKIVWRRQNKVFEGDNSISLTGLDHLPTGTYTLRVINGDRLLSEKFFMTN